MQLLSLLKATHTRFPGNIFMTTASIPKSTTFSGFPGPTPFTGFRRLKKCSVLNYHCSFASWASESNRIMCVIHPSSENSKDSLQHGSTTNASFWLQ